MTHSSQPVVISVKTGGKDSPSVQGDIPFVPVGNRGPRASKADLQISKRSVGYVWGAELMGGKRQRCGR